MENFRKAMYSACRQMDMEIVPMDIGARVMAYVNLQSGDERMVMSPRMKCELEHLQELYHIKGGETPDKDFIMLLQDYTEELKDYTDTHNGKWSPWLYELIEKRYGFKPYDL